MQHLTKTHELTQATKGQQVVMAHMPMVGAERNKYFYTKLDHPIMLISLMFQFLWKIPHHGIHGIQVASSIFYFVTKNLD